MIVKFFDDLPVGAAAVSLDQAGQCGIGGSASRDLCPHIPGQLVRNTGVLFHKLEEGAVRFSPLIKLDRWDAQTFLKNFAGVHRGGAGRDTAHVDLVHQ